MAHLVNVSVISTDQNGNPVAGSRVSARLNRADVDPVDGYIAPELFEVITDAAGTATLTLWPNARGSTQSQYECAITNPDTGRVVRFYATIPDSDCNLHEVANLPPYPGKSDGQLATDAAVAAVAPAVAAKVAAQTAQGAAEVARDSALAAQGAAETAQGAAQGFAGDASAAATASAQHATDAQTAAAGVPGTATSVATSVATAATEAALSNITILGFAGEYDATPDVAAGAVTIDFPAHGQKQRLTLAADTTINIATANLPVGNFQLKLVQDGTGGHNVTFGAPVSASRWLGSAVQPSIHPGGNGETILMFYWDGSNFIQSLAKVGAS